MINDLPLLWVMGCAGHQEELHRYDAGYRQRAGIAWCAGGEGKRVVRLLEEHVQRSRGVKEHGVGPGWLL